MKNTRITRLHMRIGDARNIWTCELGMDVIDGTTILTKTNRDSIIFLSMIALTRENHAFPSNRHLMDETLVTKCIDNTIKRRKIHSRLSFFPYKSILEVSEGDTWRLTEDFDEAFARFCDAGDRHEVVG